jgi:hypothetical protein
VEATGTSACLVMKAVLVSVCRPPRPRHAPRACRLSRPPPSVHADRGRMPALPDIIPGSRGSRQNRPEHVYASAGTDRDCPCRPPVKPAGEPWKNGAGWLQMAECARPTGKPMGLSAASQRRLAGTAPHPDAPSVASQQAHYAPTAKPWASKPGGNYR